METWQPMLIGLSVGLGLYSLTCAAAGYYIASVKNRALEEGFVFGLLFGPAGLIVIACLPVGTADQDAKAYAERVRLAVAESEAEEEQSVRRLFGAKAPDQTAETKRQARRLLGEVKE